MFFYVFESLKLNRSPPCEQYSACKTTGNRHLGIANKLVIKTLEIIDYFSPKAWWIENPSTGLLCRKIGDHQQVKILDGLDYKDVDYCAYSVVGNTREEVWNGEFPYKKATRIWSNALRHFKPKKCLGKDWCPMMKDGKHVCTYGNADTPQYYKGIRVNTDFAHRVPPKLIRALIIAADSS